VVTAAIMKSHSPPGVGWCSYEVVRRSAKIALSFGATMGVVACAFLIAVLVGKGLATASLWATFLGLPTGIVAAGATVLATARPSSKALTSPELNLPDWVVDRPTEVAEVVAALLRSNDRTVGITTALHGAGGFGKTTVAQLVCADLRIRKRFKGHIHMVTVGRDIRGADAIAAKVNEVIKAVAGEDATFTNPESAGRRLGSLLDTGPYRLLVIDDVWEPEQLAPFLEGGRRCARVVTTRVPELIAGRAVPVQVDQMSPEQAQRLLTYGLPPIHPTVTEGLLAVTGRWPLLLRLVNKILANAARIMPDVSAVSAQLLDRLRMGGPTVVDDLLAEGGAGFNVDQPHERARAVRATIEASTSLLNPNDAERFAELAVFAEDETVPFGLIARFWQATAGLDALQVSQVCARLDNLALIASGNTGAGGAAMHDVVREFLRGELGPQRLATLHEVLLDAVAADLPLASSLSRAALSPLRTAWWTLGDDERYIWEHLGASGRASPGCRPEI
jgi:hypothetical protein